MRFVIGFLSGAIFLSVFLIHYNSPNTTSFDSKWSIYLILSLLREHNADLDEYKEVIPLSDYRVETVSGHRYSIFPLGHLLIAAPLVAAYEAVYAFDGTDLYEYLKRHVPDQIVWDAERWTASIIVAAASVFIFLTSDLLLSNRKYAFLLTLIFAFSTPVWSTASRALWQHGSSILTNSLVLYLFLAARRRLWPILLAAFVLGFSYMVRPTNVIPIVFFAFYVFLRYRRFLLYFLTVVLLTLIPFTIHNSNTYDSLLSPYYLPQRLTRTHTFTTALIGNLISPNRGLFIFSPILLLSLVGILIKIRGKTFGRFDFSVLDILLTHWVAISSFPHWWGGHSFGPRLFSDVIPYFVYFLIPVFALFRRLSFVRRLILWGLIGVLAGASFFIHRRATYDWDVWLWNSTPVDVDLAPTRIWDWRDLQFLRALR